MRQWWQFIIHEQNHKFEVFSTYDDILLLIEFIVFFERIMSLEFLINAEFVISLDSYVKDENWGLIEFLQSEEYILIVWKKRVSCHEILY